MNLSDISIRRPVVAIVFNLIPVIFGIVGFYSLSVREYPAVDPPVVTVTTNYSGASPDVVDAQITERLEQAINGIEGVRFISSTSQEGRSTIRVEFVLERSLEDAANDVRDKVSQTVRRLPVDADPPTVEKADADSSPVIFMTLRSDKRDLLELSYLADTVVKERIQTIAGVSNVRIFGEKRFAMRLWLDPSKMAALGITPADVRTALEAQNVELPSGRLEGASTELGLRTYGRLTTADDFNRMIIREQAGHQILLSDVGYAALDAENTRSGIRDPKGPLIGVSVVPQPNSNAIAIADEFYRRSKTIEKELPEDIEVQMGYDFTIPVRRSIKEVEETIFIAFLLVAGVNFFFLRDLRSTLIPTITIPICLIATFFPVYVLGYSINILTLVGLVLAIGLVCDDAIVVLENIYTKIEQGMNPLRAALEGSREVYLAVIATTAALASVFLPVIFLQGLTGRLFQEFGVTLVMAVIISSFVALSLSPMMCRFLLRTKTEPGLLYRVTEPFFVALNQAYRWLLAGFMRVRWLAIPVYAGVAYAIFWFGGSLSRELAPLEDRSNIRVSVRAPEGATYEFTEGKLMDIQDYVLSKIPELYRTFSITAMFGGPVNTGLQNVYLVEPVNRERSQEQVFQQISKELSAYPWLRIFPGQPPTIGARFGGQPLQFVIQSPSLPALLEVLPTFLEKANTQPELRFVDADLKVNKPEVRIDVDRDRAAAAGVSIQEVARTMQLALGGVRYGYFLMRGRQYEVIGQLQREQRDAPDDLRNLYVRSRTEDLVSVDNFITLEEQIAPAALYRYNRYVSATISGGMSPGYSLGDGINALQRVADEVLPEGFSTALTGEARDFAESSSSLLLAFVLALTLTYLVLAAQFDSFIDPLIIMLTVPLSLAGALFSLWATGMTLNIFSQIGMIMLVGLVTKNGILIVEFANQRKVAGLDPFTAAIEASAARFRPILMTTLTTILGTMPIALALGTSSGSRQSLGIAVVGGMGFAVILTLFVVPALYSFLSRPYRRNEEEERIFGNFFRENNGYQSPTPVQETTQP